VWLAFAEKKAAAGQGRGATPSLLAALHEESKGRTLAANVALAVSNAALAGRICRELSR
jgi:pseudouridine-5'-phosphate glycosidase